MEGGQTQQWTGQSCPFQTSRQGAGNGCGLGFHSLELLPGNMPLRMVGSHPDIMDNHQAPPQTRVTSLPGQPHPSHFQHPRNTTGGRACNPGCHGPESVVLPGQNISLVIPGPHRPKHMPEVWAAPQDTAIPTPVPGATQGQTLAQVGEAAPRADRFIGAIARRSTVGLGHTFQLILLLDSIGIGRALQGSRWLVWNVGRAFS